MIFAAQAETYLRLDDTGRHAVLPRVHDRACLVDLRCVPESEDERLRAAVQAALTALTGADGGPGGTR